MGGWILLCDVRLLPFFHIEHLSYLCLGVIVQILRGDRQCFTNVKYHSMREERNETGKHQIFGRKLNKGLLFLLARALGTESERIVKVFQSK